MTRQPEPLAVFGPFKGMRYSFDPIDDGSNREYVYEAMNMVPLDPVRGGAYIRRLGDDKTLIAGSVLNGQWLGVFRKRSGFLNVGIFSGEIYLYGPGLGWTKFVTTANLTTATITLSATAACGCVTYNNKYIVNDGVNQPFSWDGTAGAGGLSLLSNAPTRCYGQPTVHYAKIFFIKDVAANSADRSTIVWSEENAENTGYVSGGYLNTWTLEQSGSGALFAVRGTNQGLYFWRARGIGVIRGAVTPAFVTNGVHDGVSTIHGTIQPFGVTNVDDDLYFLDTQTGLPFAIVNDKPVNMGQDIQDVIGNTVLASGSVGQTAGRLVAMPQYNAIATVYNLGLTGAYFLFSTITRRCLGRFSFEYTVSLDASAAPLVGEGYDAPHDIFALAVFATNAGSSYSFYTPPGGASTWYTNTSTPLTFQLTLAPYVAPPNATAQLSGVECMFDVLPRTAGVSMTATVALRTVAAELEQGSTTDLASFTLTPSGSPIIDGGRLETRGFTACDARLRNLQLLIRDSGTVQNYAWGVKRVALIGELQRAEPEVP